MNASRIRRPSSDRMGIFCRLGSAEASLPVLAPAIIYDVWTRPDVGSMWSCNASVYVDFNLLSCRQSITFFGKSYSVARSAKTSAPVEYAPVFPLAPPEYPSLSNSISPSCLGLPTLKFSPARLKISSSNSTIFWENEFDILTRVSRSTFIPKSSISDRTRTNGRSRVS